MKCPNCGFDSENNAICPICGNAMPDESHTPEPQMYTDSSTNPYQQPATPQYNAPQYYKNPYVQNHENPYAQQPQEPVYQQPAAPEYNAQPYENPYAQQPQEPVYQQPAAPQYNAPQQPNPNAQYNYTVSAPPKKSNGPAIVVTSVIASVVVVGIVIAILSVTLFNKSILNIADTNDDFSDNYYDDLYDDYYDDYDYDLEEFNDGTIHKIGESYEFDYGQITLKNAEITKKYDDGMRQYAFTIEVKNTTNEAQIYELMYDLLNSKYSFTEDSYDVVGYLEYIYTAGDYSDYDFELEPGKATEFVIYYKGIESDNTIYPRIELSDSDYNYNAIAFYEVNLGDLTKAKDTN